LPLEYVRGSGVDLRFELTAAHPGTGDLLFHPWHLDLGSVIGAAVLRIQPVQAGGIYTWPASYLDTLPPGQVSFQVLIRPWCGTPCVYSNPPGDEAVSGTVTVR
jgi:hypothetical protein